MNQATAEPRGNLQGRWVSWNGIISHPYEEMLRPRSEDELAEAVSRSESVRMIGNGQSSADIVAGAPTLISSEAYSGVISVDGVSRRITVRAGMPLRELLETIEAHGWSLPCLPDIDTVTVGGALSTGTHGTAGGAHPLAESMVACRLVTADGSVREIAETDPLMPAIRCGLGVLGVLSTVTFECRPLYYLRVQEEAVKDSDWTAQYRQWLSEYEFLRVIWLPHTGYGWVITGSQVEPDTPVEERAAPGYVRYRREVSKALYRRSAARPRFTRTANKILKRLFFSHRVVSKGTLYGATVTKSRSSPLELAEWSVALDRFDDLFAEMNHRLESSDNNAYAHIPMDVRFLKADETWLSQAYGRDTVTVGCVTRNPEDAERYEAFNLVESLFLSYQGRPHWAKRFKAGAEQLAPLWPRWREFLETRRSLDPNGKFLNRYLSELFS